MPNLPPGYLPLKCTIEGVTYQGSYWVDDSKHLVHVFTDYGNNSTDALRTGTHYERDEANRSAAQGLFQAMIRGHLIGYRHP